MAAEGPCEAGSSFGTRGYQSVAVSPEPRHLTVRDSVNRHVPRPYSKGNGNRVYGEGTQDGREYHKPATVGTAVRWACVHEAYGPHTPSASLTAGQRIRTQTRYICGNNSGNVGGQPPG